jgi:60S ribosomal protein uL30
MADHELNPAPRRLSIEELKAMAPGTARRAPPKVDIEKRKETLLRQRPSIHKLHQQKVANKQAQQAAMQEIRLQRKDEARDNYLFPEGRRWVDVNFFISKHIRTEKREKQLYLYGRQARRVSRVRDCLLMVTRVCTDAEALPQVKEALTGLRLYRPWTSVFVRRTPEILRTLFTIRRYIHVLMPTREQVLELLHSRGYAKEGKQRVQMTNAVIEKQLKDLDVWCVEDLARVLVEGGPHFTRCTMFLWPLHLDEGFANRSRKVLGMKTLWDQGLQDRREDFPRRMLQDMDTASGRQGQWLGPLKGSITAPEKRKLLESRALAPAPAPAPAPEPKEGRRAGTKRKAPAVTDGGAPLPTDQARKKAKPGPHPSLAPAPQEAPAGGAQPKRRKGRAGGPTAAADGPQ